MTSKHLSERFTDYIIKNPGKATIIIFSTIFIIIGLGALLFPTYVWDQFLWRYFWGSVVADAEDRTIGDIHEGYNILSTISYGIILAAAVFVIFRLIIVMGIELNKWFFLAVIPYILFGGFSRALEDAMLFKSPIIYIFISPVIYIVTGIMTIMLMLISQKLGKKYFRRQKKSRTQLYFLITVIILLLFMSLILFNQSWMNYQNFFLAPIIISILICMSIILIPRYIEFQRDNLMPLFFGAFGLVLFSYPAAGVVIWYLSPGEWLDFYLKSTASESVELRPAVILLVIGLALLSSVIWAGIAFIISKKTKWKEAAVFGSGVNLVLVFGQFSDASATFIAIDYYNYWEKHVLPGFLIGILDSAAVMFILKAIALIFAIYVLDILLKDDLKKYRQIVPLIKVAILVLGLAPGTRDMLRLAMGV